MEAGDMELRYLAKKLACLCERYGKKGVCQLFLACPAPEMGWTCGTVNAEDWIKAAKEHSYPIGLTLNRIFEIYSDPNHFQAGKFIHIFRSSWSPHDSSIYFQVGKKDVRLYVSFYLGTQSYCPSVEDMLANDWCIRGFTDD